MLQASRARSGGLREVGTGFGVFGCAYWRIADESCSDTTLRRRRDEWILAGAMERLREMVLAAYDRTISISWYAADKETLQSRR